MSLDIKKIPIPINVIIVKDGKATQPLVRYLTNLQAEVQSLKERIEALENP